MKNPISIDRCDGCRTTRGPSGFTLIELLVVVSIIALLISILLPSLKRAREQAKATAGLANLKGTATASITYASDDETESAIPVHPETFNAQELSLTTPRMCFGGKSGRGPWSNNSLFWGTGNQRGPATRPLNNVIFKDGFQDYYTYEGADMFDKWMQDTKLNLDLFKCPSDTGNPANTHLDDYAGSNISSYDFFGNSYYANVMWIGGSTGDLSTNSPFLRPLSRIPSPANTIYYMENVGRYYIWVDPLPVPACADYPSRVAEFNSPDLGKGWHKRDWMVQATFVDAHAAAIKRKGYVAPQLSEYPYGDWTYWNCVIFRGDGWQEDTLPSPPVRTNLPVP